MCYKMHLFLGNSAFFVNFACIPLRKWKGKEDTSHVLKSVYCLLEGTKSQPSNRIA